MHIIGIDPGLTGAVAILGASGTLKALADTPTLVLKVQRGTRMAYDVPGMVALLNDGAGNPSLQWGEESALLCKSNSLCA